MSDDSRGDELGDLDDALFGDGEAKPAPTRDPEPSSDIDWFAGIHEELATPLAAAALTSELMPDPTPESMATPAAPFESSPELGSTSSSLSSAEGPLVDAAIFGMTGAPAPHPLSRRELHAREPVPRRRRVMTLLLVIGLIALVGVGSAAVLTGGGGSSVAKSQVKVVGTALPTTTAVTHPAVTLAPVVVAPTTPPATAAAVVNTTPPRTNPPVVATDPPAPPPTEAPTTTTTTTLAPCTGTDCGVQP